MIPTSTSIMKNSEIRSIQFCCHITLVQNRQKNQRRGRQENKYAKLIYFGQQCCRIYKNNTKTENFAEKQKLTILFWFLCVFLEFGILLFNDIFLGLKRPKLEGQIE